MRLFVDAKAALCDLCGLCRLTDVLSHYTKIIILSLVIAA